MSWAILIMAVLPTASPAPGGPQWYAPSTIQIREVDVGDVVRLQRGPGFAAGGEFVMFDTRLERRSQVTTASGDPTMLPVSRGDAAIVPVSAALPADTAEPAVLRKRGTSLVDTFSVESDEPLDFGTDYTIARISRSALRGGRGGVVPDGGDPIDARTAYLYEKFFFQRLSNYHFDQYEVATPATAKPKGERNPDADELQKAFWFLENELPAVDPATGKSLGYEYDPTDLKIAEKTLGADSPAYRWIVEADAAVRDKEPDKVVGSRVRVITLVRQDPEGVQDIQDVLFVQMPELSQMPLGEAGQSAGVAAPALRGFGGVGGFGGGGGGYSGGGGGDNPEPGPTPTPTPTPPNPVPEPASLLVWACVVLAGLVWAYRRRRMPQPSV